MVSTPEYAFNQVATSLSFIDALRLGYGLCGHYLVESFDNSDGSQVRLVDAITSLDLLQSFNQCNPGFYGSRKLRNLLKYLRCGSASPMETALELLLCFPIYRGGYGLPFAALNAPLTPTIRRYTEFHQSRFRCDLLWDEAKLVVEYDGEEAHTGLENIAHDSARRNDLHNLGYVVLNVTKKQLYTDENLFRLAAQIARYLGTRLRHKDSPCDWGKRHSDLRLQLLYAEKEVNGITIPH